MLNFSPYAFVRALARAARAIAPIKVRTTLT